MANTLDPNFGGLAQLFSAADKSETPQSFDYLGSMMKGLAAAQAVNTYRQAAEDRATMREYFSGKGSGPSEIILQYAGAARQLAPSNPELAKKYHDLAMDQLKALKDSGDLEEYNRVSNLVQGTRASIMGNPNAWDKTVAADGRVVLTGKMPTAAAAGPVDTGALGEIDLNKSYMILSQVAANTGISQGEALQIMSRSNNPVLRTAASQIQMKVLEGEQNLVVPEGGSVDTRNPRARLFGGGTAGLSGGGRSASARGGRASATDTGGMGVPRIITDPATGVTYQNPQVPRGKTIQDKQEAILKSTPAAQRSVDMLANYDPEYGTAPYMAKKAYLTARDIIKATSPEESKWLQKATAYEAGLGQNFMLEATDQSGKVLSANEEKRLTSFLPKENDSPAQAFSKMVGRAAFTIAMDVSNKDFLKKPDALIQVADSPKYMQLRDALSSRLQETAVQEHVAALRQAARAKGANPDTVTPAAVRRAIIEKTRKEIYGR